MNEQIVSPFPGEHPGAFSTAPYAQACFPNGQITGLAAALAIPESSR